MTYIERQAEINRLRTEYKDVIATPLMSEGNISPDQVGMFSKREGKRWQNNAMLKMNIEARIKSLSRTDTEIETSEKVLNLNNARSRLLQIDRQIEDLASVGIGKNGKLKPTYQRTLDIVTNEKQQIIITFPELKEEDSIK